MTMFVCSLLCIIKFKCSDCNNIIYFIWFLWNTQIVDVETKEFLFYINATDPRRCNWMRYINCARYFEEQNILSEQEGIDIFYQAIKASKVLFCFCFSIEHLLCDNFRLEISMMRFVGGEFFVLHVRTPAPIFVKILFAYFVLLGLRLGPQTS